jgi:hypothetical protein
MNPRTYFTGGKDAAVNEYLKVHGLSGGKPEAGKDLSTQGRYADTLNKVSKETGVPADTLRTFARIESNFDPDANRRSNKQYKGLMQINEKQFKQYGGQGSIFDPEQNMRVGARKILDTQAQLEKGLGRKPNVSETYLGYQQGVTGALTHLRNPDRPAWQNMQEAAKSTPEWAQSAIMGNLKNEEKQRFGGDVNRITSRDFVDIWDRRVARVVGEVPKTAQAPSTTGVPPAPPAPAPSDRPALADASRVAEGAEPARGPIQPAIVPEEPATAGRFAQPGIAPVTQPNEPSIAARQAAMAQPLGNQEAQPGSQGSAPITEMPGTIVTSQALPPGSIVPDRKNDAPDVYGGNADTGGGGGSPTSALDSWKPGQPIMGALLGDIFGGGAGGGGGLFGLGGKGGGAKFQNLVQSYNPGPDTIIPAAGPEQTVLPTSLPPPPPPPPPTPPGFQNIAALQRRRQTARG